MTSSFAPPGIVSSRVIRLTLSPLEPAPVVRKA